MNLKPFVSPRGETSLWKNIPICLVDDVQKFLRKNKSSWANTDERFLYRYRGPRRPGILGGQMCLKKDANRFSVYVVDKNEYV